MIRPVDYCDFALNGDVRHRATVDVIDISSR